MNLKTSKFNHQPVLLDELMHELNPCEGQTYLDATAGGGGHARAMAKIIGYANITLIDLDPEVISTLQPEFNQSTLYNNNFATQSLIFRQQNIYFDLIVADLGLSNLQLLQDGRGFSFLKNDSLDMRFNNQVDLSLSQLLEQVNYNQLADILIKYGQEKEALNIAKAIKLEQPQTTNELTDIILKVKRQRPKYIHPATQTFMALRIWTNDELKSLETFLQVAPLLLKPQGKLAIISFHSLEDRLVKHAFRDWADGQYDCSYFLQTKKPLIPDRDSLKDHPQARSAKLRILGRL